MLNFCKIPHAHSTFALADLYLDVLAYQFAFESMPLFKFDHDWPSSLWLLTTIMLKVSKADFITVYERYRTIMALWGWVYPDMMKLNNVPSLSASLNKSFINVTPQKFCSLKIFPKYFLPIQCLKWFGNKDNFRGHLIHYYWNLVKLIWNLFGGFMLWDFHCVRCNSRLKHCQCILFSWFAINKVNAR